MPKVEKPKSAVVKPSNLKNIDRLPNKMTPIESVKPAEAIQHVADLAKKRAEKKPFHFSVYEGLTNLRFAAMHLRMVSPFFGETATQEMKEVESIVKRLEELSQKYLTEWYSAQASEK